VDAEGYDKEILKTMPEIINTYKPALLIECYKRLNKEERAELFEIVNGHDYQLYYLENFENFQSFEELKEIQLENMTDKKHFEMLALPKSKNPVA
jgi:hypothetical protein